jgi:hypothetical protein
MNKYKYLFTCLVLFSMLAVRAQDAALSAKDEQARKSIGIDSKKYAVFSKGLKQYNNRLLAIMNDSTLGRDQQRAAIAKLHEQRKAYLQRNLNIDQQKKWENLEKQNSRPEAPPAYQRQLDARKKRAQKMQQKTTKAN